MKAFRRKILVVALLSPAIAVATPLVVATDTLLPGEFSISSSFEYTHANYVSQYVENQGEFFISDSTGNSYAGTGRISVAAGLTDTLRAGVSLPYLMFQTSESHVTFGSQFADYQWDFSGAKDVSVTLNHLLFHGYGRIAIGGTLWIPTGDDTPSYARVIENGSVLTSNGSIGGAGHGRYDGQLDIHWSGEGARIAPLFSMHYLHRGSRTKNGVNYDYGDTVELNVGGLLNPSSLWTIHSALTAGYHATEQIGGTRYYPFPFGSYLVEAFAKLSPSLYLNARLMQHREFYQGYDKVLANGSATRTYSRDVTTSFRVGMEFNW